MGAAQADRVVACDVTGVPAKVACVQALARLQLAAGRNGCVVVLRGASPELLELVGLMGLAEVLRCEGASAGDASSVVEPER